MAEICGSYGKHVRMMSWFTSHMATGTRDMPEQSYSSALKTLQRPYRILLQHVFSDLFLWLWNREALCSLCKIGGVPRRDIRSESPDLMRWKVKADLKAFSAVLNAPSGLYSFLD